MYIVQIENKIVINSLQICINCLSNNQIFESSMNKNMNPDSLSVQQANQQVLMFTKLYEHINKHQQQTICLLLQQIKELQQQMIKEANQIQILYQKYHQTQQQLEQFYLKKQEQNKQRQQLIKKSQQLLQNRNNSISVANQRIRKLQKAQQNIKMEIKLYQNSNQNIMNQIKVCQARLDSLTLEYKNTEGQLIKIQQQIKQYNDLIDQCYLGKKKLNSELQQLRGNIRVYCRIRPFLSQYEQPIYELLNQNTLKLKVPKENHKSQNHLKDYTFNFEQIFNMQQNQEDIFTQLCQLIQSAVDGKNVCIFAYGQTGSGKTYTMQGGNTQQSKGIIARSIKLIFSQVKRAQKYKWNSQVSVTIQQVYLESVRDLIQPKSDDLQIVSRFIVKQPQQLQFYIEQATKNRKVAQTSCNQHSSRSHLIFTIHIFSKNQQKNLQRRGSLNLVDLAGSQRVNSSRVQGDRMKQTQAINKSLTNLGIVISALAKKQQHIPYRNSKLTFLLQKYLQGDSKTLMFVNISPKVSDFNQTICSLRFAETVKECKMKK